MSEREKRRVCHVSLSLQTGGLERLLVDYARLHDAERYELSFVTMNGELGPPAAEIRELGCAVHALEATGRIGRMRELHRLFRQGRYDLVHTHGNYPHLYATLPARLSGARAIVHTKHGQACVHGWGAQRLWRLMSGMTNRIVAISHATERICLETNRESRSKLHCIWNGIDVDRFAYRGATMAPTAITVGRLCQDKALEILLEATQLAACEVPELRVIIVGGGEEQERLQALTHEMAMEERVTFLGYRQDVVDLLAQSGFYVCTSRTEGLSLSLAEAMAVGLPVIATDVGGNAEIVADGESGIIVPPLDSKAFAAAMVELCRDPDRCQRFGAAGRERVVRHFNIRGMIAQYESLYDELLSNGDVD